MIRGGAFWTLGESNQRDAAPSYRKCPVFFFFLFRRFYVFHQQRAQLTTAAITGEDNSNRNQNWCVNVGGYTGFGSTVGSDYYDDYCGPQ